MHDAFLAVGAATDLRAHARSLRRQWDDAVAGDRPTSVRSVIAESWSRMRGAGLTPDRLRPVAALDDDELAAAREASPLAVALPTLRGALSAFADDAEHVMVVCDADGQLLWIEGHEAVLEQARSIAFRPGMRWTEDSAGTNAIGTALAIDHAVQIFSAEHFLPEQHPWWCSAAPIHDPVSGRLLGVVDLSGPQRTAHPHSLGLVMAAAAMAEGALRLHADQAAARRPDPPVRSGGAEVPRARPRVVLLGAGHPRLVLPGRDPIGLGLRQAEVLALLALHPEGLTAEQLTLGLYGDAGNPVTTRALVSRLRDVAEPILATRPYRLVGDVVVDVAEVRGLLAAGRGEAAVAAYPGPLLPDSTAEGVVAAREELDAAVRQVALAGGPDGLWRWLGTPTGREDLAALERFAAIAPADDGRHALAGARQRALLTAWG